MAMFGASAAILSAVSCVTGRAVIECELHIALQDAVTKAFASKHTRTRQAYIELARFFEAQLAQKHGAGAAQLALLTRYSSKPLRSS